MPSDSLECLAGIVEGEGCIDMPKIRLASGNLCRQPRLTVKMTDQDIVERVSRLFQTGPPVWVSGKGRRKDTWIARRTGKEALAIMFSIFPLLGQRRRSKVETTLSMWEHHCA